MSVFDCERGIFINRGCPICTKDRFYDFARPLIKKPWYKRLKNWLRGYKPAKPYWIDDGKDDGFVDVPLRHGELSHKVKPEDGGLLHKVVLKTIIVCHYCRRDLRCLGEPCNCPGWITAHDG